MGQMLKVKKDPATVVRKNKERDKANTYNMQMLSNSLAVGGEEGDDSAVAGGQNQSIMN